MNDLIWKLFWGERNKWNKILKSVWGSWGEFGMFYDNGKNVYPFCARVEVISIDGRQKIENKHLYRMRAYVMKQASWRLYNLLIVEKSPKSSRFLGHRLQLQKFHLCFYFETFRQEESEELIHMFGGLGELGENSNGLNFRQK